MNEEKAALRAVYARLRRQWTDAQKAVMHRALTDSVTAQPAYQSAGAILCYASRAEEIDTWGILRAAWACGKTAALPRCEGDGRMAFYRVTDEAQLQKGTFGILEPNGGCALYTPASDDLCIVPALAFDRRGFRLGYGGGYYDRYLAAHPMRTIGLCYPNCLADRLPAEPFDISVQQVICCNIP